MRVQLLDDSCQVGDVVREIGRAFAVPASVAVVDEHPSVRHVELIVELGDGDGDLRAVPVPIVMVAVTIA